jgi:hypothetical protein
VPEPLTVGKQALLGARLHALRAGDELAQLRQTRGAARGVARKRVPAPAGGDEVAPGAAQLAAAAELLLAGEGVEDVELVRGPREAPLLELAGHGDEALDERGQVLARDRPPPGVGARAPVGEDPAGGDEALLPGGPELGDRFQLGVVEDAVGEVELGLDVGLLRAGPEVAGVAGRAEQEPDRLGEDRLPGPGLPGDRVQAGREREVGVADEDEVLDAEAAEHQLAGHLAI